MEEVEQEVLDELRSLGFEATKLEEREEHGVKTPDFACADADDSYLIELKSRGSKEEDWVQIGRGLESEEVVERTSRIERSNTVSSIIAHACKQLKAEGGDSKFRIIWIHARGLNEEAQVSIFCASVYGTASLVELPDPSNLKEGEAKPHTCFFFNNSDFFRRKGVLDGVIMSTSEGHQLHINPYSSNADRLRRSRLAEEIPYFCVCEHEDAKGILIADTDVDREETHEVTSYLRDKYDCGPLSIMNNYHYESFSAIQMI